MEIRGKLNEQEARSLRNLMLTKLDRLSRWGLGELIGVIALLTVLRLSFDASSVRTRVIARLLALFATGWGVQSHRRLIAKDIRSFISALPERYELRHAGIEANFSSGIKVSAPWTTLKLWRRNQSFVLLCGRKGKVEIAFPLADLKEEEHKELFELLGEHLNRIE